MNTSYVEEIAKKSSIVFFGQIFERAASIIYGFLVVRILGAEAFGAFTSVFSFLSIMTVFSLIGFPFSLNKKLPEYNARRESLIAGSIASFAYLFVITVSGIISLLIFAFSGKISLMIFREASFQSLLIVTSPILVLISFDTVQTVIFKANRMIRNVSISNYILKPTLKCAIIILYSFIYQNRDVWILVFINYVFYLTGILYLGYYAFKYKLHAGLFLRYRHIYAEVLRFSAPLFFASLIGSVLNNFDIISIEYFLESKEVGIYRIASSFAYINTFFVTSIDMIFAPIISELHAKKEFDKIGSIYALTTKACNMFSFVFLSIVIVLSREILQIYGTEFIAASTVLILLTTGQLIRSSVGSAVYLLSMSNMPGYILVSSIITVLANITLNILMIPEFGINGAAAATMVSLLIRNLIYLYYIKRKLNLWPYDKSYLKILACFLFVMGAGFLLYGYLTVHWLLVLCIVSLFMCCLFALLFFFFVLEFKEKEFYKKQIIKLCHRR